MLGGGLGVEQGAPSTGVLAGEQGFEREHGAARDIASFERMSIEVDDEVRELGQILQVRVIGATAASLSTLCRGHAAPGADDGKVGHDGV